MREIVTHLAFKDRAEAAVEFYTSLFPDARVTGMTWFRAGEPGPGAACGPSGSSCSAGSSSP